MIELNKVYNADCLEIMRSMPDKCIDLVLTDPPYGIGESGGKNHTRGKLCKSREYKELNWDNKIPEREIFNEIFRISKNQVIFGGNYFIEYLKNTQCMIVWDKNNGNTDFADSELAWTSFKSAVRNFKYTWHGMLQEDMKNKETRYHPTQKPVALFSWILKNYAKPNDIIFDPFAGSGTTAIACMQMDHPYILVEKEKDYYDIIMKRIAKETEQFQLFGGEV